MKNTKNTSKNRPSFIRPLAVTAILSAASFVLQLLEFSLPFVPDFLKFDFSDLPALLGSFALGPLWGMAISLLKNCLHLPFSSSMFVGELSNFLLSAIFVGTAGIIYRRHKTKTTALVGGAVGSGASALLSLATNYFIVYPFYIKLFFGGDREALMSAYNRFRRQAVFGPRRVQSALHLGKVFAGHHSGPFDLQASLSVAEGQGVLMSDRSLASVRELVVIG